MFGLDVMMGGMLAALAGVAIPVIIHLLHRQRTQPVAWGAMQFLLESKLQQRRRKKVDNWLLLLLRMLLIAVIVFLLSRPLLKSSSFSPLADSTATDIGIVIDHSLSTGRRAGDSTVFQQSVAALDQLTAAGVLRAADTVSIVLAEHEARPFTPFPVSPSKLSAEIGRLKALKPGLSDASIPVAVQSVRDLITRKGRNTRKVIIVLSDAQRTGWQVNNLAAWNAALDKRIKGVEPAVRMYEVPVAPDATLPNITVTDLAVTPSLVSTGRPAEITATVVNNGSREMPGMNARLMVGSRQASQQPVPALAAGQSRTIRFEHTFTDPGSSPIEVHVDANDALEADNSAFGAVNAWQNLPVLIIDGKLTGTGVNADSMSTAALFTAFRSSRFLQLAMLSDAANPDAPSLVKPMIVGSLDGRVASKLNDFACVVVNDVPRLLPEVQSRLADYARAGHGVWVILGERSEAAFIRDGLAQANLFNAGSPQQKQAAGDKSTALDVKDPSSAMLAQLTSPEHNVLTGMKTFKWWSFQPHDRERKVLISAAETGDPLIVERAIGPNGGCVVVWATPVDGSAWNNWPGEKMFAPLVNETLYHLSAGMTGGAQNKRVESGDKLVWTGPGRPAVQSIAITRPDGTKVERRPFTRDGRQVLVYGDTDLPGRYELRFDQTGMPPVYFGVGVSGGELDETPLSDSDRAWLSHPDHKYLEARIERNQLAQALGTPSKGAELWPYLALGLLGMLMFETYMTYRLVRRQAGPAVDLESGVAI